MQEAQLNAENEALLILWNEERDRAQMAADHKQRAELAYDKFYIFNQQKQLVSCCFVPPTLKEKCQQTYINTDAFIVLQEVSELSRVMSNS